jgi:hypothetical protein
MAKSKKRSKIEPVGLYFGRAKAIVVLAPRGNNNDERTSTNFVVLDPR